MRSHGIDRKLRAGSRTGCIGVSYVESLNGRKRVEQPRRYFSAHTRAWNGRRWKARNRKFCLDTLGARNAWRQALRCRAAYEQAFAEGRAA